ncbi:MAG: RdgB/HAM1 family non-canonical purine NTP pyrophosphatase [Parcubacteria group bacterium]|nr:RdgB/HAM1 family non-canonical purine NTP pyrophosphatase [Parcubacteria group bacterium]
MIHFITNNKNKFAEAKAILPQLKQYAIDLPELQEINPKKIIEMKLQAAFLHRTGNFIVEDTGLYIHALNGLPGPLIRWFLSTVGNEGIWKMVENYKNHTAEAKVTIGYARSTNHIHYFVGSIKGTIVKPRGATNFGWDHLFQPDEYNKTFAEMSREEKNTISMRALAFTKLKKFLKKR